MHRDPKSARLLASFAHDFGVSSRTARRSRDSGSARWRSWLTAREGAPPATPAAGESPAAADPAPTADAADGVEHEVRRLRSECRGLAHRVEAATRSGDLGRELALRRALNSSRETLRKLEIASPEVLLAGGEFVRNEEVNKKFVRYAGRLVSLIENLPGAIAAALPPDPAGDLLAAIQSEVDRLRRAAAEISFDNPEPDAASEHNGNGDAGEEGSPHDGERSPLVEFDTAATA